MIVTLGGERVEVKSMDRHECIDWLAEHTPFTRDAWMGYPLAMLRQCVGSVAYSENMGERGR